MKISLRFKIAAAYLLILLAGFLSLATWGGSLIRKNAENDAVNSLYKEANYLAASYQVNTGAVNQRELEALAFSSGADIWILDLDGKLLASTGSSAVPEAVTAFDPTDGSEGYYMRGDFYGSFPRETLSVYAPLSKHVVAEGYAVLHYPYSAVEKAADRQSVVAYITYSFMLVFLFFFTMYIEFALVRPIRRVRRATMEYANGNPNFPAEIRTHDEIRDISEAGKELAHQLTSASDDQRRFLANISHDFRSPLTSIRGYIAAIQDGTIPYEMQGKYLNVVINETDRLTKLANGLLDITQVENGIILEKTLFDINGLLRSILPTFEGRVAEKNLSFEVTFEEESQNVHADKARIQQVLYNLIDNAIKFSGNGSTVDISTSLRGDRVFVSVKDHGIGIEKENINKIWDRFYKIDSSRGKDKKGTGLGLSIVREIIQAHREHIDVISTPGVGTEFIFTLSAVQPKE